MDEVTTTMTGFPVKDITHRPRRKQGDMIRLNNLEDTSEDSVTVQNISGDSPANHKVTVITLERAISFFKQMSKDPINGELYEATAYWLEDLLVTRSPKTEEVARQIIEEGDEDNEDNSEG